MKTLLLLSLLGLFGCAEKSAHMLVPKQCLGPIAVTDFTKPCHPTGAESALCDGVKIKFHCVQAVTGKH